MNCETVQEQISAFCDGELGPLAAWRVRSHVRRCAACEAERASLQRLKGRMLEFDIAPAVSDSSVSPSSQNRTDRTASRRLVLTTGLGAAVFLAVGWTLLLRSQNSSPDKTADGSRKSSSVTFTWNEAPPHEKNKGTTRSTNTRQGPPPDRPRVVRHRDTPRNQTVFPDVERRPAPVQGVHNDLAYLNTDTVRNLARWTQQPSDELSLFIARLDSKVRGGDDFVAVSFPPVASNERKALEAAARVYQKEKEVVDARLTRRISLGVKAMAFSDLCDKIKVMTGIEVTAGRSVADEKVTLFCKDQPLRDIMRRITRVFSFTWARSGEEGSYRYELIQDLKSQLAEEELRNRDHHAALVALDEAMASFRPLLNLSPGEVRKQMETADGEAKRQLSRMARESWGGVQVYHRLAPGDQAALRNGEELTFSGFSSDPNRRLSPELSQPIKRAFPSLHQEGSDPGVGFAQQADVSPMVKLKIDRSEIGQLSLKADISVHRVKPGGEPAEGYGTSAVLATATSPSVANPNNAQTNQALKSDLFFKKTVTLRPKPSCPWFAENGSKKNTTPPSPLPYSALDFERMNRGTGQKPHVISADVWEEVHRQTGLPIVADSYMRLYELQALTQENVTLFDALARIGDKMGVRWKMEEGFLQCRSTSFFWDKLKEIPHRLLAKWQQRSRENGGLPLDDLLEMSTLSDIQLDSAAMGDVVHHCWGLEEWDTLQTPIGYYSPRLFARLLAGMAAEQRRHALQTEGFAFGDLTPSQRQEFLRAFLKQYPFYTSQPDLLLQARFRIDHVPAGWYQWRPRVDPDKQTEMWKQRVIAGKTAESVLEAARKLDATVTAEQIERSEGVLSVTQFNGKGEAFPTAGLRPHLFGKFDR